jgi:restriction system protein
LSWQEFELLVAEAFRRKDFAVTEKGGGGADCGINLTLKKNGKKSTIQCKGQLSLSDSLDITIFIFLFCIT